MVDSCPKDSPGQQAQTLLEAAKEVATFFGRIGSVRMDRLIAAIAREEVKQASLQDDAGRYAYWKSKATRYESERDTCYSDHQKEAARAQQAEAECREQRARAESGEDRNRDLDEKLIAAHGKTHAESERAKKAEAELARLGQQLARLCELQANPPVIVTQPFEGDPQTCAFGPNAFGGKPKRDGADEDPVDPTTGFTFATYRRLLEALRGKS